MCNLRIRTAHCASGFIARQVRVLYYLNGSTVRPLTMEYLNKTQCRELLRIQSKDTINKYLKTLGLFEKTRFNWEEIKRVLEIQIFLGLKHGRNSLSHFEKMSRQELEQTFEIYGVDVNARLEALQKIHRDSVQLKLV